MSDLWITVIDAVAGICAYAALHHALVAWRRPLDRTHMLFALLCAFGAVFFLGTGQAYRAGSAEAIIAVRRWQMGAGIAFIGLLPWFIAEYCRIASRALPLALSAWLAMVFLAHVLLPLGIEYTALPPYTQMTLPWGERVLDLRGRPGGPWHYAWWFGIFAVFAFGLNASLRHLGGSERPRGAALAAGLGIFLGCLVLQFAVNQRWLEFANVGEFGLLALILQMSLALTRELRENERRLQLVVDKVPAAVYLKDAGGRYLLVNRECERYTGITAAAMLGRTDRELFPPAQAAVVQANDRVVLTGRRAVRFEEQAGGEGRHTYVSLKVPLAYADGTPYGICGVSTDVTHQRAAENEMRLLRRQLWHADRVARTGALAASLAHELNQPLAAVLHNAQAARRLLQKGERQWETIDEILADIVRDDKRAAAVVSGLRDFVRQEAPERTAVDLAALARELLDLLNTELIKQEVAVELRIDAGCMASANRAQLQQVLLNLVMNAVDAMRSRPAGAR